MSEQTFRVYEPGDRLTVCCSFDFEKSAGEIYNANLPLSKQQFADCNALIKRLAKGETLSTDAFRQEQDGYAFRSGNLRIYAIYSDKHKGVLVLSHCIWKVKAKLAKADNTRMKKCRTAFDKLKAIPQNA